MEIEQERNHLGKFPNLIENLPCCFYIVEAKPPYHLLYANAEMLRLFDCRNFAELWHHTNGIAWNVAVLDDRERFKQEILHEITAKDGPFSHVCAHLFTRTNRVRYADISGHPVETEAYGKVYYCVLHEIDIPQSGTVVDRDIRDYVISHLDAAIENHWIQVYYQPVIRTLTGEICGMEALARWVDPHIGFLSPASFIPVLEQVRLIHQLDAYVLDAVCRTLRQRLNHELPVTPVSFNLSRYDFDLLDIFSLVETTRKKYEIPRDFLHVEITESALSKNAKAVHQALDRLRSEGYEVWLDDFGSDYSSLNILKDYTVDLVKLDMAFLSDFTEKSRCIISSVISMAKDLGIKTLAEGVETKEHEAFLASIGCGRQQGYFYGKPRPLAGTLAHIEAEGRSIEPRKWFHYNDMASMAIRQTDRTCAIFDVREEDGHFRFLYSNTAYRKQLRALGYQCRDVIESFNGPHKTNVYHTCLYFIDRSRKTGQTESFCYIDGGDYVSVHVRVVCEMNHHLLVHLEFENISQSDAGLQRSKLDDHLRYLYSMFDRVNLVDFHKDTIEPLYNHMGEEVLSIQSTVHDIRQALQDFAAKNVYSSDRNGYLAFCDPDTVASRIRQSPHGRISHQFRVRDAQGNYTWQECLAVLLNSGQYPLILTASKVVAPPHEIAAPSAQQATLPALLWQNFQAYTQFCYFWKDKERRFLGATKAFLKHYGFSSEQDILGKTDEEMNWHLDNEAYRQDELDVLRKGKVVENVTGECIVRGVPHRITCYKRPLYQDGQIIGLFGVFFDADEFYHKIHKSLPSPYEDSVTGLRNRQGFLGELIRYQEAYIMEYRPYALILLEGRFDVHGQNSYETSVHQALAREEARILRKLAGYDSTIARLQTATFAILRYEDLPGSSEALARELQRGLQSIHEVDGNPVTITFRCGMVHATDASLRHHPYRKKRSISAIYRLAMERLRHKRHKEAGPASSK